MIRLAGLGGVSGNDAAAWADAAVRARAVDLPESRSPDGD